ncbi:MAG TPA: hypothetical protein PK784_01870 [Tenuifilaceae bacterium]|nr:hypothetical protein [Tenuifilaceae bacterium]HPN20748.1 hypothetical protein [Tenuifilaceae bacterium]
MRCLLIFGFAILLLYSCKEPKNGKELIEMMHQKHSQNFYQTLCFSQKVFHYNNDTLISEDIWHEAYKSPGRLILKFTDWNSGNGMIFSNDSLYVFDKGVLAKKIERLHDLIILGLDINNQDPEKTIKQVKRMGYDLTLINEVSLNGNFAWIVGDSTKLCFWVDAKSLLFLKMRRVTDSTFREVEFSKYDAIQGLAVATQIKFYNAPNKVEMIEEYFNVRVNCNVDDSIFYPFKFSSSKW